MDIEPDVSALTGVRRRSSRRLWEGVLRRDPCAYCGGPPLSPNEIDHIEPRALGGADHWTNYTGACWGCNRSKVSIPLLEILFGVAVEETLALPGYYYRNRVAAAWGRVESVQNELASPHPIRNRELFALVDKLVAAKREAMSVGCSGRNPPVPFLESGSWS